MPDGRPAPIYVDEGFSQLRSGIAQSIASQTTCAWLRTIRTAVDGNVVETVANASAVIHDIATWDELADIPDLIVGTDALTATGRIRALDAALTGVRTLGIDPESSHLDGLELQLDAVIARPGADLECPSP